MFVVLFLVNICNINIGYATNLKLSDSISQVLAKTITTSDICKQVKDKKVVKKQKIKKVVKKHTTKYLGKLPLHLVAVVLLVQKVQTQTKSGFGQM